MGGKYHTHVRMKNVFHKRTSSVRPFVLSIMCKYSFVFVLLAIFELHYLHSVCEKDCERIANKEHFKKFTTEEVREFVVRDYCLLARYLIRRSMLTNGYIVSWFDSVVNDIVKDFIYLPVISLFRRYGV